MILRGSRGEIEFPALISIWRSAVEATHDFLSVEDREEIEKQVVSAYLPSVRLTIAEVDGQPVGFAGTAGDRLEMLFVDDAFRGRGIGSVLLDHVIREQGVKELDVNEQNPQALTFYYHKGFVGIGQSEHDDAGRPYPLLHMRLDERERS